MSSGAAVREAFAKQAASCAQLGSPFTSALLAGVGPILDRGTETGRRVLDWDGPPDATGDAVALRLAGALHALTRNGRLPGLAALYPPAPLPTPETRARATLAAIADADAEIAAWLQHAPQTNEVARSAALYLGLMTVTAATGLPIHLFEIGASAGLNMNLDRYAYRFGKARFGDQRSPVVLAPEWSGPVPDGRTPVVAARRGCDLNPLDMTDPAERERLTAFIWPDQPDRLARVSAAIEIARQYPPTLDRADAADWVETHLADAPAAPGAPGARVLMHSIAYQYFPRATKDRITAAMGQFGQAATVHAPLAWLSFELEDEAGPYLTLRQWPGGARRTLAEAGPHLQHVHWHVSPG